MATIKQIKLGDTPYDINAKYIQDASGNAKSWSDITDLVDAGFKAIVSTNAATTPLGVTWTNSSGQLVTGTLTASGADKNAIYFVPQGAVSTNNNYDEYIVSGSAWEKIGSTAVDISGKADKGTYETDSKGAHTHSVTGTVTVPTISPTSKHLTISRSTNVAVASDGTATVLTGVKAGGTAKFVKSYPGATSKLKTASISPAASKSITQVTGNTSVTASKVSVTAGSAASFTQGSKASWSASVDANGVLSFSFTANGNDSFTANTPTVVSATDVSASKVTSASVTVAQVGTAVTVATGALDANDTAGATIMTGLGTATTDDAVTSVAANGTATALTGVKVSTQPAFSLADTEATGGVTFVSSVGTGTTSASLTNGSAVSAGAHKHNVTI